jgi:serine/threonine-protein kinase RsbT
MNAEVRTPIRRDIDLARAVMLVRKFAMENEFGETSSALLCTAASELGRNILKYADHGTLTVRSIHDGHSTGIEVDVEDHGPGIEDIEMAMRDNVSTGGTLGLGLPGVKRMMDTFRIESTVGRGTRVVVRKWR